MFVPMFELHVAHRRMNRVENAHVILCPHVSMHINRKHKLATTTQTHMHTCTASRFRRHRRNAHNLTHTTRIFLEACTIYTHSHVCCIRFTFNRVCTVQCKFHVFAVLMLDIRFDSVRQGRI